MPFTVEEIVGEARSWPAEKIGELVGLLTEELQSIDGQIESHWKAEIDGRMDEIQSGKVRPLPLEESLARLRKIAGV
jgi:putative addiction module component (TIGR02574 family)